MSFELILPFLRPIKPLLLDDSIGEIMGNPDRRRFKNVTESFAAGPPRGRRVIREVSAIKGYATSSERLLMELIYEVNHATV